MTRPLITLLTDFGSADHYVAAMKGVILGICPEAVVVDVTHETKAFAVTEAAFTLTQVWKTFPAGTVHVVVVDPGVGSTRRPVVAGVEGHLFVGPDNGVLSRVLAGTAPCTVRAITAEQYFRQPVSRTFHGRDIFAPIAAQLAGGVAVEALGDIVEDWVRLPDWAPVENGPQTWTGTILKADRFGNLITSFETANWGWLEECGFEMAAGSLRVRRFAQNYAEGTAGELFLIAGSAGYLEISANQKSAASITGLMAGDAVNLNYRTA